MPPFSVSFCCLGLEKDFICIQETQAAHTMELAEGVPLPLIGSTNKMPSNIETDCEMKPEGIPTAHTTGQRIPYICFEKQPAYCCPTRTCPWKPSIWTSMPWSTVWSYTERAPTSLTESSSVEGGLAPFMFAIHQGVPEYHESQMAFPGWGCEAQNGLEASSPGMMLDPLASGAATGAFGSCRSPPPKLHTCNDDTRHQAWWRSAQGAGPPIQAQLFEPPPGLVCITPHQH